MRIKVYPPPGFKSDKINERGWMELPEGSTLGDVVRMIRVPRILAKLLIVSVNGVKSDFDTVLNNGDSVGFFSLIAGG